MRNIYTFLYTIHKVASDQVEKHQYQKSPGQKFECWPEVNNIYVCFTTHTFIDQKIFYINCFCFATYDELIY